MRVVKRTLLATLVLLSVTASAVLLLIFDAGPTVTRPGEVSVADVQRARALLLRHDPRRVPDGVAQRVMLTPQDVTLLAQYAASRWRRAAASVHLRDGAARVQVSVAVPGMPLRRWLNVQATLRDAAGLPEVQTLRIGRLPVPDALAQPVTAFLVARLGADLPLALARDMTQTVAFMPSAVVISYRWQVGATDRVRDMLMPPDDLARLEAANADLARVLASQRGGGALSLAILLPPLLTSAARRASVGDLVAEQRAVLATLALYVNGQRMSRWAQQASDWPQPPFRPVTLGGRPDLAKHFLVSAVVAAQAGSPLADAVGRTKEVDDARRGTGFSFADLAADRAGTLLGELASASPQALADAAAVGLAESDIMPSVADLPEQMNTEQFQARFGGIGAPAYAAMMRTIEQRLARLPLYRGRALTR